MDDPHPRLLFAFYIRASAIASRHKTNFGAEKPRLYFASGTSPFYGKA